MPHDAPPPRLVAASWPALEQCEVDGWLVRRSAGVTSRANSVLPLRAPRDVEAALATVEALYAQRGLPTTFQVTTDAEPAGLDALLVARGYARAGQTLVQVAQTADVLAALRSAWRHRVGVSVSTEPDERWTRTWWAVDGRPGDGASAVAQQILRGAPSVYVSVTESEQPTEAVAVGRATVRDGWVGLSCVAVSPLHRRRGHAGRVTGALLEIGRRQGADRAWLQVVEQNESARALWADAGFSTVGGYHYRSQGPGPHPG